MKNQLIISLNNFIAIQQQTNFVKEYIKINYYNKEKEKKKVFFRKNLQINEIIKIL